MLNFDQEEEVFFDSVDCLSSESSSVAEEELVINRLEYEIWMNEPQSVRERRENFLRHIGLVDVAPESDMVLERITEVSGAGPSSGALIPNDAEGSLDCVVREMDGEASSHFSESRRDLSDVNSMDVQERSFRNLPSAQQSSFREVKAREEDSNNFIMDRKKMRKWWKRLLKKQRGKGDLCSCKKSLSGLSPDTSEINRMKVCPNKKKCMEFSAIYSGQEIKAHNGSIWTMKFSPDGQYLASGGEDGIVRIWHIKSLDSSCKSLIAESDIRSNLNDGKSSFGRKKTSHYSIMIPDKIFQIEESPMQELRGHCGDVLDLAWSNNNCLLSSSKDKTVRLWKVGCDKCLNIFCHNDYVTCVQFNPADENYFISGSIDGKVRIWGLPEGRVVDWTNARDVVTAISYQPDGRGFIVGSVSGTCRFYGSSGNHLQLEAQLRIDGRKRNNKITGIEFSKEEGQRIMITSEDSKVRILDGCNVIQKYRGLRNSGSQMSASFASTGRHIISAGEDSHVYVWNYNSFSAQSSKQTKSIRSCEHFFSEGVSLAVPWSGMAKDREYLCTDLSCSFQRPDLMDSDYWIRDSQRFSLSSWFSLDVPFSKVSATWPEEQLVLSDVPVEEPHHRRHKCSASSDAWGLVIVTASLDGTIRTYHNYGLPVRL